jgi:hypothetical protein
MNDNFMTINDFGCQRKRTKFPESHFNLPGQILKQIFQTLLLFFHCQ